MTKNQTIHTLLEKWNTSGLSFDELKEFEKSILKVLSLVKLEKMLQSKKI